MGKRLQVRLLPNWARAENPNGPATFYRTDSDPSGTLQVSLYAEYKSGAVPNPSTKALIELAQGHGQRHKAGKLLKTLSGACDLGNFGSAVFESAKFARVQFWYLSNGCDFVLATHICTIEPVAAEVEEAQQIVAMLGLSAGDAGITHIMARMSRARTLIGPLFLEVFSGALRKA